MKLLQDLLYKIPLEITQGSTRVEVREIAFDSRHITPKSLFVAVPGTKSDGHDFIDTAIEKGAVAVVSERQRDVPENCTLIVVQNSALALSLLAANFYDNPSEELSLIGITGTNGKTTTATLLYELGTALNRKSGLLSTVKNRVGKTEIPATHTTPDPITINKLLRMMVDEGCEYAFMEVSSHGLAQHRVDGLKFAGAVFTNITHDHLDYHKTFDAYINTKKRLFDMLPKESFALVNSDDRNGMKMLQNCKARKLTFALKSPADYKARILEQQLNGTLIRINQHEVWSRLIGTFNTYNLAAIYGVCSELGFDRLETLTALSKLSAVEGRFQYVQSTTGIIGIVDYAHTPDALKNVLETIRGIRSGNEKVFCVVGCGGDRDKSKRPEMARIGADMSDHLILTADNPRSEDPNDIIRDMESGLDPNARRKKLSIADRREAIRTACTMATIGDIVLVAGKGHEKYQEVNGVKLPFDDLEELSLAFNEMKK